jgi:hypothetical protein
MGKPSKYKGLPSELIKDGDIIEQTYGKTTLILPGYITS